MSRYILCAISLIFLLNCKKEGPKDNNKIEMLFKKEGVLQITNREKTIKELDIEIADSESQRMTGLMHRSNMEEDRGMLFIHDRVEPVKYWMRNTRIPLDIIYFNSDTVIINIARNAAPFQETGVEGSKSAAKYVLEINGGLSDKWGLEEGMTKISWKKQ
jgi:uncharacterized membrane protein (UPF0127 family)